MENNDEVLLKVEHLCQYFKMGPGAELKAVDDVSFDVKKGEVFGLVGESGCGKTTTGRSIIKLYDITSGNVYFKGQRICAGIRSYKNEIKRLKANYAADIAELNGHQKEELTANPENAESIKAKYKEIVDAKRADLKKAVAEQNELIRSAKNDHKNCEKIYLKKLQEEYKETVERDGSYENFSEEDKKKFRVIENMPKAPKRNWLFGALAVFVAALVFFITSVALFVQFNKTYGHYEVVSSVVTAADEATGTTTVTYIVNEKEYQTVLDYYDPDQGVSGNGQTYRLKIYYNADNPAEVSVKKPEATAGTATLIVFFIVAVAGCVMLIVINEKYNPTRLVTKIQMIFQDPIASLNPRMTVKDIIAEGLVIGGEKNKKYIDEQVYKVLDLVGLVPEHAGRYPHEFSGGQRQRIGVARSVIMEPELIIADEPISALDVSIQAQVINLLNDLRKDLGLTILFIAHDLSVVKYFSDRIGVMYFGKMVELATSDELFAHPMHPYTKSLLSAIPLPDPEYEKNRKRFVYNPLAEHDYSVDKPELKEVSEGHFVYCNQSEYEKYVSELKKA